MTSKVSEDHEYIVEMYKEQSERINNIENSVERIEKNIGSISDHLLRFEDYFIYYKKPLTKSSEADSVNGYAMRSQAIPHTTYL